MFTTHRLEEPRKRAYASYEARHAWILVKQSGNTVLPLLAREQAGISEEPVPYILAVRIKSLQGPQTPTTNSGKPWVVPWAAAILQLPPTLTPRSVQARQPMANLHHGRKPKEGPSFGERWGALTAPLKLSHLAVGQNQWCHFGDRCTTHFSPCLWGFGCPLGVRFGF